MLQRSQFLFHASLLTTLLLLSGPSCSPDERRLIHSSRSAQSGNVDPEAGAAGAEESGGTAGETEEAASGKGGDSSAGGARVSSGGSGGGTSRGGASPSTGDAGAKDHGGDSGAAGSAGTAFSGPCGDIDGNGVDDCSETLVLNSRFDSNADHWTSGKWDPSNARAAAPSGSLLVLNDSPVVPEVGFRLLAAEQCVQVTGDFEYEVAARVMIPAGQGEGFGGINLWIFANDGCQGTFVTGLSPATTEITNAWTIVDGKFKMPTAARSMSVRLAATRPFAQPKLQVLFDDVLVKQTSL